MLSIITRRLALAIPILLLTTTITFVLQGLVPGDAARAIAGIGATQETYERIREELNLHLPLWQQYGLYMGGLVRGDLGSSLFSGEPVAQTIAARLPVTLSIIVGATLLAALLGILLGTLSARVGGAVARVIDVVSLTGSALPNFWLALILVQVFAIAIPLLPATGFVPFTVSPSLWAASLVLPVVALAIGGIADIAKMTRDAIGTSLDQPYMRTLRAAGIGETALLWRHALKNAGVPIVTVIGLGFIAALIGSLFVENVFALPGLGSLINQATLQGDIPVIQGVALAYAAVVIVVNLLVDLSYGLLNPKLRTR
ncbi:ABC transporter permease [Microbacterium sp. RD1]|uniref:ABC transporter permease n=1 Tax=Microbacterium sp. RD1 TaxID=3457313 RepID=UPI003FA52CC5